MPRLKSNPIALSFCWHLRLGMFRGIEPARMKAYADFFYHNYLKQRLERQRMLITGACSDAAVARKALAGHRRLHRLFLEAADLPRALGQMEEKIEEHVRFERVSLYADLARGGCSTVLADFLDLENVFEVEFLNQLGGWPDRYWELC